LYASRNPHRWRFAGLEKLNSRDKGSHAANFLYHHAVWIAGNHGERSILRFDVIRMSIL
jgi:hypothetical protein